jgi:putative ABC transport system ATP-binding protein
MIDASGPAYELSAVGKSYRAGERDIPVLSGIDLKINQGESVAIMGPSGSGKSTLLTLLGCLDTQSTGTFKMGGRDVSALSDDDVAQLRASTIGFVFQAFHLLPAYDALANVALGALYGLGDGDAVRARAESLLATVMMTERLNAAPNTLSGGEKQRVAIARALMNDPSIILADEPTGSLDQKTGGEVLQLLCGIRERGKTLITVTHDPAVAAVMERVIVIRDGRIDREMRGAELAA